MATLSCPARCRIAVLACCRIRREHARRHANEVVDRALEQPGGTELCWRRGTSLPHSRARNRHRCRQRRRWHGSRCRRRRQRGCARIGRGPGECTTGELPTGKRGGFLLEVGERALTGEARAWLLVVRDWPVCSQLSLLDCSGAASRSQLAVGRDVQVGDNSVEIGKRRRCKMTFGVRHGNEQTPLFLKVVRGEESHEW
eukprot:6212073-Pleurochrysis_carterae.AAC.1